MRRDVPVMFPYFEITLAGWVYIQYHHVSSGWYCINKFQNYSRSTFLTVFALGELPRASPHLCTGGRAAGDGDYAVRHGRLPSRGFNPCQNPDLEVFKNDVGPRVTILSLSFILNIFICIYVYIYIRIYIYYNNICTYLEYWGSSPMIFNSDASQRIRKHPNIVRRSSMGASWTELQCKKMAACPGKRNSRLNLDGFSPSIEDLNMNWLALFQ